MNVFKKNNRKDKGCPLQKITFIRELKWLPKHLRNNWEALKKAQHT